MAGNYTLFPNPSGSNASVGVNGSPAPSSSTEVAGVGPDGNLHPLSTDNSGVLNVNLSTTSIEIGKVDQGTPNNDANAWPVRITDGTHDATVTAGGALNVSIAAGLANPLPVQDSAAETSLASIDTKLTSPLSVTGPLTDVQLRASPVPVSGSVSVSGPVDQGAPNTDANGWPVKITNGTDEAGVTNLGELVTVNASISTTLVAAPSVATFVAGIGDGGDLEPFKIDTTTAFVGSLRVETNAEAQNNNPAPLGLMVIGGIDAGNASFIGVTSNRMNVNSFQSTSPWVVSGTVAVSNFPATQPVSGTVAVTQSTSPWVVSGTVTANQGTSPWVVSLTSTTITGTVAVTQSTSPWVDNVSQFGGTNISTGTGAGGSGIPRVTVSNDSNVLARASTPTAGTVTQAAITVGTTAVRLTVSGSAPSATRSVLAADPDSASTAKFYIGSSSVTNSGATRGIQIVAGQSFIANSDAGDYYIISDTAAQTVYVMEQA